MRITLLGMAITVVITLWGAAEAAQNGALTPFHTDPSCWKGPRIFQTQEADAASLSQIKISRIDQSEIANQNMEWALSPNGAYRFSTMAESKEKGSTVTLLVDMERSYVLKVHVIDPVFITDERWINEKLLFLRIWGSHIRGTDVILDVEAEKIRIADNFEYGAIAYEQFQKACKPPNSTCPCRLK